MAPLVEGWGTVKAGRRTRFYPPRLLDPGRLGKTTQQWQILLASLESATALLRQLTLSNSSRILQSTSTDATMIPRSRRVLYSFCLAALEEETWDLIFLSLSVRSEFKKCPWLAYFSDLSDLLIFLGKIAPHRVWHPECSLITSKLSLLFIFSRSGRSEDQESPLTMGISCA